MKKIYRMLIIFIPILFLSCGDTGVSPREEPTNEDAIYNIIRYDRPSEFNVDLYNLAIPETLLFQSGPIVPIHHWYNIERDSLFIGIDIRYVQPGDPSGTIPSADVLLTKRFWGTLEIIGVDTAGGNDTPVRMSKEFTITGEIASRFEKYGFDYNRRRGWLLTELSDAVFSGGYISAFQNITIHTQSGSDYIVNSSLKNISDIIQFEPNDSLTVIINTASAGDFVSLNYRSADGYTTISMAPEGSNQHITGFRLTGSLGYDHFLIDVKASGTLTDTTAFKSGAIGVVYKVR